MYCPKCNEYGTKVIDSRMLPGGVNIRWRKHECSHCGHRFYTKEVIDKSISGSIQFDRLSYKNGLKLKEKENG